MTDREEIALEVPTQCIPCSIQNNLVSVDCQLPCDLQLNTADKILTLLKQGGYAKLVTPQHLPLTDESKGYDLNLDQISIVKQMWKDGWRRIEL